MREGKVFKWVALGLAFATCALAAQAGTVYGAITALVGGGVGFLATVLVERDKK